MVLPEMLAILSKKNLQGFPYGGKFQRVLLLEPLGSLREKPAGTPNAGNAGIGRVTREGKMCNSRKLEGRFETEAAI
jgi:hypothetical protein